MQAITAMGGCGPDPDFVNHSYLFYTPYNMSSMLLFPYHCREFVTDNLVCLVLISLHQLPSIPLLGACIKTIFCSLIPLGFPQMLRSSCGFAFCLIGTCKL